MPLPFSRVQPIATQDVSASFEAVVVSAGTAIDLTLSGARFHQISWKVLGSPASATVALDSSADGNTWTAGGAIVGQTATSPGASPITLADVNFVRINVTALSAGASLYIQYRGWVQLVPVVGAGAAGSAPVGNPIVVAGINPSTGFLQTLNVSGSGVINLGPAALNADGFNASQANFNSTGGLMVNMAALTGTPGANWFALRTCAVFKSVTATASGNTALWTPAAGKKFRLMRFRVMVPGNAAFATTAGTVVMTFQDAGVATGITTHTVQVPLAAGTVTGAQYVSPWIDLGNGFLSAAANNVLNINLVLNGAGAFSGGIIVDACGTEE